MSKLLFEKWNSQKGKGSISKAVNKLDRPTKSSIAKADVVHNEVFEEMDCLQCANCCKSIPPIVSARDSKRIAKHLGVDRKSFSEKYLIVDEDGDQVINSSPCPFLEADNKCQIYEVRPAACRQYPHSGDFQFFENLNLHKRNAKYCPALFEILKRLAQ